MVSDTVRESYEKLKRDCVQGSIDGAKKSAAIGTASLASWGPYALCVAFNASSEALAVAAIVASYGSLSGIYGIVLGAASYCDYREYKEEALQMEQKYPELKLDIK